MSDSSQQPQSDNPNVPQIPSFLYYAEKEYFAGRAMGAMLYGIVIILFFQCMEALNDPANKIKRSVRWGLMAHTTALLVFLTIPISMDLYMASNELVDNRTFPGGRRLLPGPIGYESFHQNRTFNSLSNVMFPLSQWLADGLLLYRCYVIYSMNYWVMIFPCLVYLASIAMGIVRIKSRLDVDPNFVTLGTAYFLICFSLNALLTLMIVTRLVLHRRNIRKAMGGSDKTSGLYTTIVVMLVESYAIYAAALLSYIVSSTLESWVVTIFSKTTGQVQVIAPYLITLRVANRRALTSEMVTHGSGNIGSIQFRSQRTTDSDESLSGGDPTSFTQTNGGASDEFGKGAEDAVGGVLRYLKT